MNVEKLFSLIILAVFWDAPSSKQDFKMAEAPRIFKRVSNARETERQIESMVKAKLIFSIKIVRHFVFDQLSIVLWDQNARFLHTVDQDYEEE